MKHPHQLNKLAFGEASLTYYHTEPSKYPYLNLNIRPTQEFAVEQGRLKLASLSFSSGDNQGVTLVTPDTADLMELGEEEFIIRRGSKQARLRLDSYINTEENYVSVRPFYSLRQQVVY